MFKSNFPPCFQHSFFLLCPPPNPNTHKHPSILLSWMQCWTMASSLEAGRLEWNEIWLVNVQSSSARVHLGIHLRQINWMHSWSCLWKAQAVNDTPTILGLFLWISVKSTLPQVALCIINWTSEIFARLVVSRQTNQWSPPFTDTHKHRHRYCSTNWCGGVSLSLLL